MMTRLIFYFAAIAALAVAFPLSSRAQSVINIDLSYKIVLNPVNGARPMNGGSPVSDANLDTAINAMNLLYDSYSRGYRFRRVDPVIEVGGQGDTTGPSRWFNTDFFGTNGGTLKDQMETAAEGDARYAWNNNAINIYITNGLCGGICSFPGDEIIIIGGCSAANGTLHLHEIGHFFDLCHTQGCPCGSCDPARTGTCHTTPGDDGIVDTLPDLPCWNRDDIANRSFGTTYANLTAGQQTRVDNVFLNIMSYHGNASRLTERQLDVWADAATSDRAEVVSGRMIFVDDGSLSVPLGTSLRPYKTVQAGISSADANGGDIVLIRPGAYNEPLTISKRVTLRATRLGPVAIGTSITPATLAAQTPAEIEAALKLQLGASAVGGERLDFPGGGKSRP